jgi:HEAT repeat protein
LIDLMQNDKKASVRREAIRALGTVGAPADISRLELALETERDLTNQTAIRRAIDLLRKLI